MGLRQGWVGRCGGIRKPLLGQETPLRSEGTHVEIRETSQHILGRRIGPLVRLCTSLYQALGGGLKEDPNSLPLGDSWGLLLRMSLTRPSRGGEGEEAPSQAQCCFWPPVAPHSLGGAGWKRCRVGGDLSAWVVTRARRGVPAQQPGCFQQALMVITVIEAARSL